MTRRPHLDDRDPAEPQEWRECSSPGIRRLALAATTEAVAKSRDRRVAEQRQARETEMKESTDE